MTDYIGECRLTTRVGYVDINRYLLTSVNRNRQIITLVRGDGVCVVLCFIIIIYHIKNFILKKESYIIIM